MKRLLNIVKWLLFEIGTSVIPVFILFVTILMLLFCGVDDGNLWKSLAFFCGLLLMIVCENMEFGSPYLREYKRLMRRTIRHRINPRKHNLDKEF